MKKDSRISNAQDAALDRGMDIYTDVTRELKQREFGNLQEKMKERKSKKKKEEGDGEADGE